MTSSDSGAGGRLPATTAAVIPAHTTSTERASAPSCGGEAELSRERAASVLYALGPGGERFALVEPAGWKDADTATVADPRVWRRCHRRSHRWCRRSRR